MKKTRQRFRSLPTSFLDPLWLRFVRPSPSSGGGSRGAAGVEAERAPADERKRDVRKPPPPVGSSGTTGFGGGGRAGRTSTHWRMSIGGCGGSEGCEKGERGKKDVLGREEVGVDGWDEYGVLTLDVDCIGEEGVEKVCRGLKCAWLEERCECESIERVW